MQVTLLMVASVDGKTTFWKEPHIHGWSSREDQKHFEEVKRAYSVIIMGRITYDAVKAGIQHTTTHRRIILTRKPELYKRDEVTGQLEFTDERPEELLNRLASEGINRVLLVGGSNINSAFLKTKLITDIQLTVEPRIFGSGNALFSDDLLDVHLSLVSEHKLNTEGTLLLTYNVHYDN